MKRPKKRPTSVVLPPGLKRQIGRLVRIEESINQLKQAIDQLHNEVMAHDDRLDSLKQRAAAVEPYQPIYGVSGIIDDPERPTADRCLAIVDAFDGDISNYNVLDVGSSLGYVSFYLADRGANVEGWEISPDNLAVAQAAQGINAIPSRFLNKALNLESAADIPFNKFDIVVALSIFHHVIYDEGLANTQKVVKTLLDKIPVMIVELARKGEDDSLWWNDAQPDNELDIFKDLDVKIEPIAEFKTHLSSKPRKLYRVSKAHVKVNHKLYETISTTRYAYPNSPVPRTGLKRKYIASREYFIKHYEFKPVKSDNAEQILNEITVLNTLRRLGYKHPSLPKLQDFEVTQTGASIVFQKQQGQLAIEAPAMVQALGAARIAGDILEVLALLEEAGYYHNDVRSWNIMVTKKHATLIDYGLAAVRPLSNNAVDYLWALEAIMSGKKEVTVQHKSKTLPPKTNFITDKKLAQLYELIAKGENSFLKLKALTA